VKLAITGVFESTKPNSIVAEMKSSKLQEVGSGVNLNNYQNEEDNNLITKYYCGVHLSSNLYLSYSRKLDKVSYFVVALVLPVSFPGISLHEVI
jgi:hypothetical protein